MKQKAIQAIIERLRESDSEPFEINDITISGEDRERYAKQIEEYLEEGAFVDDPFYKSDFDIIKEIQQDLEDLDEGDIWGEDDDDLGSSLLSDSEYPDGPVTADYVYDYITDRAMQKAGYDGLNDPGMDDYAFFIILSSIAVGETCEEVQDRMDYMTMTTPFGFSPIDEDDLPRIYALIEERCQLEILAYKVANQDLEEFKAAPPLVMEKIKQLLP